MDIKIIGLFIASGALIDLARRQRRPYRCPCETFSILRGYGGAGGRKKKGAERMHTGIDFRLPVGTNIYAPADGVVKSVLHYTIDKKENKWPIYAGYGLFMDIAHDDGSITRYAHLLDVTVEKGDRVQRGQIIAHSGDTGHVKNIPRLHFEIRPDGTSSADPMKLIRW